MSKGSFSILIFHGSANAEAILSAQSFADALVSRFECENFAISFLRGGSPSLKESIASAVISGKTDIQLIPLLILPGNHTEHDIPQIISESKKEFPLLRIGLSECLIRNPAFVDFVSKQLKEAKP